MKEKTGEHPEPSTVPGPLWGLIHKTVVDGRVERWGRGALGGSQGVRGRDRA